MKYFFLPLAIVMGVGCALIFSREIVMFTVNMLTDMVNCLIYLIQ